MNLEMLAVDPKKLINPFDHPLIERLPRPTVYRWLSSGQLASLKVGKRYYSTAEAITEFVRISNERKAKAKQKTKAERKREIEAAEDYLAKRRAGK